jgi:alpha-L-fucosidase
MKVNGEGIYGTIPNNVYESGNWRFTKNKSGKHIYAFYLPGEIESGIPTQIAIPGVKPLANSKIYVLGYNKPLKWKSVNTDITISLPDEIKQRLKDAPALTFKIQTSN